MTDTREWLVCRWRRMAHLIALSGLVAGLFPGTVLAMGSLNNGGFIKGANMPWIDGQFYNDLAVNPHYPGWGSAYNSAHMNSDLADLHSMGITVVRFWVNTDDQGCTLDGNGYVTGVTSLFWTNLDNLVSLASTNGISLYLTLNEGRADWLTNSAMANAYKTNCLTPLIQRYKGNKGVFAIDLMNEIDGVVADPVMGNPWISSGATWTQAKAYMTNFTAAIHSADSNRLVSCSQVYHGWSNLTSWKGLGLDFYDFHYYADTISLPSVASLNMDKPVYIGECGQANANTNWIDSLQSACELEALNSGYNGGYAGVSIWSYSLPDWQTSGYMQYAMLNPNGSWREVCYTIQNWIPTPAPVVSSFSIYGDALTNGFQDWSWANSVNLTNSAPVYSGSYSIMVTAAQYQALWLYHAPFSTAPYASLSFWINGGAAGAQGLQVMGVVTNAYQAITNLLALPTNTWMQFTIPLIALGVANRTNCQGFWFYASNSGATTYCVDSIQLNNAPPPSLAIVPANPASGLFIVRLDGISGQTYWFETSTNLVDWTSVSTNVLISPSMMITNTVRTNSNHQFCRGIWLQ